MFSLISRADKLFGSIHHFIISFFFLLRRKTGAYFSRYDEHRSNLPGILHSSIIYLFHLELLYCFYVKKIPVIRVT